MQYVIKKAMGGTKQICQPIENCPGEFVVIATFANGPLQRHLIECLKEGFISAGDTLYDNDRRVWLVGDVGQLDNS